MFTICVFRRYGIAVPILFFLIGLLLQIIVDRKNGYYTNHLWTLGLNLLVTGILTGILSCLVDPPPSSSTSSGNDYSYLSLRELDLEDVKRDVKGSLEHFLVDENEEDMFCYVPLNRCAMGLMATGIVMVGVGLLMLQ